jgi:RNA polymerase sigma-70 factor, ECF subfamily
VEIFVESRPGGAGQPSEVDAFADLYNRTFNPLVAYCRRYCPPGYDPEDIAQEALAKAWSSWDRYSPARPFWPWVATIARRLCVDYWRRDERAVARAGGSVALEPCTQPRPDELSEAADECRMAVSAFRRLRPDHQRIVGLRDIEGWSYEDIARFEGVTVESIRGSLRRARMSLRKSYETLAKGGVMVGVPGLAGLVRLFQQARARMAVRMARWQTTLNDTGIATTGLGDALVSLMAISVAVVGFGAPGGEVVSAGGGDSSVSAPSAGAVGGAAAGAGASTSQTASNGDGPTTPVSLPVDGWTPSDYSGADNILGVDGTNPDNSTIYDFEVSPSFPVDHTVFAVGKKAGCVGECYTIFKSTDGGANWNDLKTVGLLTPRIMLPPAFPADERIFATGAIGFQVSENGGRSFNTLFASWGTAAMSPAFSSGDPRILLPDAPGLQYNDRTKLPEPMNLRPGPSTLSQEFTFGFPSAYDPAHPVMYVGAALPAASGTQGVVYRCEGTTCGQAIALPSVVGAPRIKVVPTAGGDVVLAVRDQHVFRSVDGAATFQKVSLPVIGTTLLNETVGHNSRVFAVALVDYKSRLLASDDAGATWLQLGDPTGDGASMVTVQPLPNGAILTSMTGRKAGFACSHDEGKTWSKRC